MYNSHGDVTAPVNKNGNLAVQYYYDAFGVITEETATANNPYRYAGYEYDKGSGLYYLKSRHYDPAIARFMQEDT
jgi:YD repeat-containing protein